VSTQVAKHKTKTLNKHKVWKNEFLATIVDMFKNRSNGKENMTQARVKPIHVPLA